MSSRHQQEQIGMAEQEVVNSFTGQTYHSKDVPALDDNLQALIKARNAIVQYYTNESLEIPAALVQLKWKNRREIYPLLAKEEVYGAVIQKIIQRYPQLQEQIIEMVEHHYQQIKQQETATLAMARKLAEESYHAPAPVFVDAALDLPANGKRETEPEEK